MAWRYLAQLVLNFGFLINIPPTKISSSEKGKEKVGIQLFILPSAGKSKSEGSEVGAGCWSQWPEGTAHQLLREEAGLCPDSDSQSPALPTGPRGPRSAACARVCERCSSAREIES